MHLATQQLSAASASRYFSPAPPQGPKILPICFGGKAKAKLLEQVRAQAVMGISRSKRRYDKILRCSQPFLSAFSCLKVRNIAEQTCRSETIQSKTFEIKNCREREQARQIRQSHTTQSARDNACELDKALSAMGKVCLRALIPKTGPLPHAARPQNDRTEKAQPEI